MTHPARIFFSSFLFNEHGILSFLVEAKNLLICSSNWKNLLSLNFIIKGSLEGGGSDSLLHDAQGKTHAQLLLLMYIEVPDFFSKYIYTLPDLEK